jgi:hypothetical protein
MNWSEYQIAIYEAGQNTNNNLSVQAVAGSGKCLEKNTLVIMSDGNLKPVQDISVGESVMGPDSTPRKVLSTTSGTSQMYKIVPEKGEPWVCNDSHILTIYRGRQDQILDVNIQDILNRTRMNTFHEEDGYTDAKLIRASISFEEKEVVIDPYLLGVWLGNENSNNTTMYLHNKIIPFEYLTNSEYVRLEVLAGLVDTSGDYCNREIYCITTKLETLRDNILYLCRSLGFAAYSFVKRGEFGDYHTISITGNLERVPVRLVDKKAFPKRQVKSVLRTGFSIEDYGIGEYYGFSLSGDGRFLLGDFTVTHNSTTLFELAQRLEGNVLFLAFNKDIAAYAKQKMGKCPNIDCRTFHSFGLQLIKEEIGWYPEVDNGKLYSFLLRQFPKVLRGKSDQNYMPRNITRKVVKAIRQLGMMSYDEDDIREFVISASGIFAFDPKNRGKEEAWLYSHIEQIPGILRALDKLPERDPEPEFDAHGNELDNRWRKIIDFEDMVRLPCVYNMVEQKSSLADIILVDECLPYYIPVLLSDGRSLPIGEIVENKLDVSVLGYDEKSGKNIPCRVVGYQKFRNNKALIKINYSTNFVVCTEDHKIWISKNKIDWEWVPAFSVCPGMYVQNVVLDGYSNNCIGITEVESVEETSTNDMIVYDITVEKTHNFYANGILVHNCQDMNTYQIELIRQLFAKGVRTICVGDKLQAIYAFRGSYADSIDRLVDMTNAVELPLSVTYRCKSKIVSFTNRKIESSVMKPVRDGGTVKNIKKRDFVKRVVNDNVRMIIGARNKSLIEAWILLARNKIASSLKGTGVVSEIRKIHDEYRPGTIEKFLENINKALTSSILYNENGEESGSSMPTRAVELYLGIQEIISIYECKTMPDFFEILNDMETDCDRELHTIHSAKGLEAENVIVLEDWFDNPQIENMKYVAYTRAIDTLFLVQDWMKKEDKP